MGKQDLENGQLLEGVQAKEGQECGGVHKKDCTYKSGSLPAVACVLTWLAPASGCVCLQG